jgi:hypothetical protein
MLPLVDTYAYPSNRIRSEMYYFIFYTLTQINHEALIGSESRRVPLNIFCLKAIIIYQRYLSSHHLPPVEALLFKETPYRSLELQSSDFYLFFVNSGIPSFSIF